MATEITQNPVAWTVTVNDQPVTATAGQTILEVVRAHKLDDIPTLCHDPRLEPYGSCFLCVVEVEGAPRLQPACVTRVRDGMKVTTRSPRITNARKTALELLLTDHYADCLCPAKNACPAGVDVQGYMSLATLGHYQEALDLIRQNNPLPMTCGRVCVRKCEVNCLRQHVDEAVGINFIKRYVAEQSGPTVKKPADWRPSGKRVAIVGGGPGGLTCAYYLTLAGHAVTIFEALPRLGGMLRYGIPAYRLPRAELDAEIQGILDLGVQVELGKTLGKDFTVESLRAQQGFDAVFIALGAPRGKKMGLAHEDAIEGVSPALDFLRDCELRGVPELTGRVVVVGGGNSAIDAARTSLRCGAESVTIVYRRTRAEMPAHHEEIDAAEKEGVKLELLAAPLELLERDGRLTGIRCQRMQLGEPDASGRRKPVPVAGAVVDIPCSYIFAAIGQDTELEALAGEPAEAQPVVSRWATLVADEATMATSVPGVFAGGDVVLGPAAAIDAIGQGRVAAAAIDQYLRSGVATGLPREFHSSREFFHKLGQEDFATVERQQRSVMPEREPGERIHDFVQVETGLGRVPMRYEANRCMECGCKSVFECDLKRYAGEYGVDLTRLAGEVRRHKADLSHPLLSLDPNKCVLCSRCIRTCSEIVGLGVLGLVGRGFATVVSPVLGKNLAGSDCIACGECVESCPTGALEARLPYGKQGPWPTVAKASVCNFCSLGCELRLHVAADGLLWASAATEAGPGRDRLCRKGRFDTGLLHGPDRLRQPLVRKNGHLEAAPWDEAFQTAARVFRDATQTWGADAIGLLVAPRLTLEEAWLTRQLAGALGTGAVGSLALGMRGGPRRDLDEIMGATMSTCRLEDVAAADLILLAGAAPETTHPVLGMTIRQAVNRGAELLVVNSTATSLARWAGKHGGLWLPARRGTAGLVYATAIAQILREGKNVSGFDSAALAAALTDLTPAATAATTGLETPTMTKLANKLATSRKVVAIYDLDDTREQAASDLSALAQLLIVTGHLGKTGEKPGEGLLLLRADAGGVGAALAGIDAMSHPERLRAALVLFEDPLREKTYDGPRPLVVMDHILTATARQAEVVLPAATLAEIEGTMISCDNRVIALTAACTPAPGLSNVEILVRLAASLGRVGLATTPEAIRRDLAASLGLEVAALEKARSERTVWSARVMAPQYLLPLSLDRIFHQGS